MGMLSIWGKRFSLAFRYEEAHDSPIGTTHPVQLLLGLLLILLILLILPSASCRSPQVISEDDYTFIAIVYSEIIGDEDPKHLIRNLDGTPFDTLDMKAEYNLTPSGNPRLSGKIVLFDPTEICYHFFCKKPEEGKPLQILIGGEWKLIEYRAGVWVHSTQYSSLLQLHMEKSCP